MPQFDTSTFASQIFWLFISFSLLYLVIARFALPVLRKVLHDRRFKISDNLDVAEKLKQESEEIHAKIDNDISLARSNCLQIIEKSKIEISQKAEKANNELESKLKIQAKESESKLSLVQKDVQDVMNDIIAEISTNVVHKLSGIEVSSDQIKTRIN